MPRRLSVKPVDHPNQDPTQRRTIHSRMAEAMDILVDRILDELQDPNAKLGPAKIREIAALAKGAGVSLADARSALGLANRPDPVLDSLADVDPDSIFGPDTLQ